MKKFLCICNFDSIEDWYISCPSADDARCLFLKYLRSRFRDEFIKWIAIYELVHEEDL